MDGPNSLSLRKFSNKVAAVVALVFVVVGLVVNPDITDSYLISASAIGLIWGTLRCLGFGERQWQNLVIILLMVHIQLQFFPVNVSENFAKALLSFMTFFSIAFLHVLLVVWLKEYEQRRAQS